MAPTISSAEITGRLQKSGSGLRGCGEGLSEVPGMGQVCP
jgi:hypothetical protein